MSKQIAWTLYNILTSVIRIISNSQPELRGSKSVCLLLPLNLLPLREEAIIKDLVETGYTEFHYHKNLCEIIRSGKVVEKWFTIRYVLMALIWVIIGGPVAPVSLFRPCWPAAPVAPVVSEDLCGHGVSWAIFSLQNSTDSTWRHSNYPLWQIYFLSFVGYVHIF